MSDPPPSKPRDFLMKLWTGWMVFVVGGPLLLIYLMVMKVDWIEPVSTGINLLIFAGIVYFSIRIALSFPKYENLIAVSLSIGGVIVSVGIFFGACALSL